MASSRKQERMRKRSSMVHFVNHGIKLGHSPALNGKGVRRAFLAQDNFCVEFSDGTWTRVESKKDRNLLYHQCLGGGKPRKDH